MRIELTAVGLLVLTSLVTHPIGAQQNEPRFAYASGTQRYRLTTRVHREQNQGGGRAPFEFDVKTVQLITLQLAPQSPDTVRLTITIDSVSVVSSLAAPQPDVQALIGTKITGLMSPQGRLYAFDPPSNTTNPQIAALYPAFKRFLFALPTAQLSVGSKWVDTTTEQLQREGFAITSRTITSSAVAGDTTVNGKHAWRIERRAEIAQSGDKNEAGNSIHLIGEATVSGVHLVSREGIYLGSHSTQRSSLTLTMKDSEGSPINQTITSTVERLPRGS